MGELFQSSILMRSASNLMRSASALMRSDSILMRQNETRLGPQNAPPTVSQTRLFGPRGFREVDFGPQGPQMTPECCPQMRLI